MKRIPVCFTNNHYELVTAERLEKLLEAGKIKAFRRTTGWVMVDQDPVRKKDCGYSGPERRTGKKRMCCRGFSHRQIVATVQKERECLTCINMIHGKCIVTAIKVR